MGARLEATAWHIANAYRRTQTFAIAVLIITGVKTGPAKAAKPKPPSFDNDSSAHHGVKGKICDGHFIEYAGHSGWGNQLVELRHALELAFVSNRTLLLAPMVSHSRSLPYGSCDPDKHHNTVRDIRKKSHKLFMHTKMYQRMDTILNVTLLGEVVPVQDYKEWHSVCAHELKESDIGFSLHECTDNSTWVLSREIKGGSELLKGRDPLYIDNLQRDRHKMLSLGSVFSANLFSGEFEDGRSTSSTSTKDGLSLESRLQLDKRINYRDDLLESACEMSKSLRPYASMHIRVTDGPFKKRSDLRNQVITTQMAQTLAAVDAGLKSGRIMHDLKDCGVSKVFRLFVMTDKSEFDALFGNKAVKTGVDNLKSALSEHGIGFRMAAIRDANVTMASMKPVLHKGTSFMVMDVMLASMAEYGFAPFPGSTLSRHVSGLIAVRRPEELCASHWGSAMRAADRACGSNHILDRNSNIVARENRLAAEAAEAVEAVYAAGPTITKVPKQHEKHSH